MKCEMNMSDNGRGPTGVEQYWKCGKPAKFVIQRRSKDRKLYVCGIHAAAERKIAMRLKFNLPKPI